VKSLAILLVVWLGLIAAADCDPAARGILTGAALIVGVVAALVSVYVSTERRP
jgi:hypothetical protein